MNDPLHEKNYVHSRTDSMHYMYLGHWAILCQSRPYPYAIVDFIRQSGTKNLASAGKNRSQMPSAHSSP